MNSNCEGIPRTMCLRNESDEIVIESKHQIVSEQTQKCHPWYEKERPIQNNYNIIIVCINTHIDIYEKTSSNNTFPPFHLHNPPYAFT